MKYEVLIKCVYCESYLKVLHDKEEYQEYLEMREDGKGYCCSNCTSKSHDRFKREFKEAEEKEAENG